MAQLADKFQEVKGLIPDYPTQAQDEAENGSNLCVEAANDLQNLIGKFTDAGVSGEVLDALVAFKTNYLG